METNLLRYYFYFILFYFFLLIQRMRTLTASQLYCVSMASKLLLLRNTIQNNMNGFYDYPSKILCAINYEQATFTYLHS